MNETIAAPLPSSAPPLPAPLPPRLVFSGPRPVFVRLALRGALLELLTLGFYRFWLATDIRRHLWSSTSVGGDAPEYVGTAKELFLGFLFALAIMAPIYLIYFLVGVEAERQQAFSSIPLILFFYLFAQFAIYRARRYRLSRTVWRGVRFWMTGSGVSYAARAGLWTLAVVATLGIALPWARASLEGYKMRHTSYGDLRGRFEATGGELFRRGWGLWVAAWLLLTPFALLAWMPRAGLLSMFFWVAAPFIYAAFKGIEWRWWVAGIRIGDVRFESDLAGAGFVDLYWKWVGWIGLLLLVVGVWFAFVIYLGYAATDGLVADPGPDATIEQHTEAAGQRWILVFQQIPVLLGMGVGYVAGALAVGALMRVYLMRDIWQRVAESVTVQNLAAADDVVARGDTVSALGEGFAQSLDVTGF